MRVIKFRGKSLKTGEWFYGNLYDRDTHGRTHICTTRGGCLCIDPSTVGQYTGLKDCNGRDIYEGDILHFFNGLNEVVVYDDNIGAFIVLMPNVPNYKNYYAIILGDSLSDGPEVIGNIHDNPELVKGGEK